VPDPVGDAFEAHVERLGDRWLDPEVLTAESPGVRAVLVTRVMDGGVGNGGWVSLFVEGQEPVVRLAPEAYRTLGLEALARLAERALAHGFDPDDPDEAFWEALDAEWFALPDQEPAREAYVLAHPEEFAVAR
jgi:hypothetical protein